MIDRLHDLLGEETIKALVSAFYRRVKQDDLVGAMYPPDDWEGAEKRLADFLIYRFGGSDRYIQERGHPRLRGRHMPFAIDSKARDRWLQMMTESMEEVRIPQEVQEVMSAFFFQIADFMRNQPDAS